MNKIILVGMPFCGKSSVGKIISEKLKYKFIDTDELIEKKEGISISNIFDIKGEKYFREMECILIEEIKYIKNVVISTGGGLPIYNNNMDKLNKIGLTFFINTPLKELKNRLINNDDRPLLRNDGFKKIEEMFVLRMPIYKSAHIIIDANDMTLEEIASIILTEINLH